MCVPFVLHGIRTSGIVQVMESRPRVILQFGIFVASLFRASRALLRPVPKPWDMLSPEVTDLDKSGFQAIEKRPQINETCGQDTQTLYHLRTECHWPYLEG